MVVLRIKNEPGYKRNDYAKIGFLSYKYIYNTCFACMPICYDRNKIFFLTRPWQFGLDSASS